MLIHLDPFGRWDMIQIMNEHNLLMFIDCIFGQILQLMGNCFEEKKIIQAAYTYEQARGDFAVPADKVDIDTLKNDTLKNDTLKNDMLKNDILKNDMLKNDTLKNDTLKNDTWKEEKTDGEEEI